MMQRLCRLLRVTHPQPSNPGLVLGHGDTVPTDGSVGYMTGGLWCHSDGSGGSALYVNEGSQTSSDFNAVGSADNVPFLDVAYTGRIRLGTFATGASTSTSVVLDADLDLYSDGQLEAMGVFAGTSENAGSAYSAKAGRFRHVVNASDATIEAETYGLIGQLVVRSATLGHLHAGLMGTFEGHTEGVILSTGYTFGHAAVMARVGGAATITATNPICGFVAFWNNTAALASGHSVAYAADCVGTTYKWDYGVDFPGDSVVTGIRVGAFASSAATTSGVPFSTDQDIYSDGQLSTLDLHGASASDLGSGYCAKVIRARHVVNVTAAAHETYGIMGQVVVKDTSLSHLHAGIIGTFEGHTSGVTLNTGYTMGHAAVMARVGGHAAITATDPICGFLAFNNAGAALASGLQIAYGSAAYSASYPWDALLGGAECDTILYVPTATDYECGVKTATVTPTGNTTYAVKIRIGASTYAYIPCYASDAFGN